MMSVSRADQFISQRQRLPKERSNRFGCYPRPVILTFLYKGRLTDSCVWKRSDRVAAKQPTM